MSLYKSRDQKRHAAARRAQFALKVALERIDYMEDVRNELAALERGEAVLTSTEDYATDAQAALPLPKPEGE